jgi:DNA-binding winged helix-turn-helix (wHTH) protein
VNLDTYRVQVAGTYITLTTQEFDLLVLMVVRRDTLVSFTEMAQWLWERTGNAYETRVREIIGKIRKRLTASDPYQVLRVPNHGYTFLDRARLEWKPERDQEPLSASPPVCEAEYQTPRLPRLIEVSGPV